MLNNTNRIRNLDPGALAAWRCLRRLLAPIQWKVIENFVGFEDAVAAMAVQKKYLINFE
jgi:hypothetical protein